MLAQRTLQIKEIVEDYDKVRECIPHEETPFTPDPGKPPVIRRAESVAAMCGHIGTPHMPGSRLAGLGSYLFTPPPVYLTEEERSAIRDYPKSCSSALMTALEEKIFCLVPYLPGHIAVDQTFILQNGVNGMIARLEKRLEDPGLNEYQKNFLEAAKIEWKGCLRYAERYSEYYQELSKREKDAALSREYAELSALIAKVPANPAETFVEALQSMWFVYRCLHMEDSSGHTFGRLDQILYPYYKRDIEQGVITREDARDYFHDFWLKFCAAHTLFEHSGEADYGLAGEIGERSVRNGLYWPSNLYFITEKHVDDGYPINLSGLDEKGNDATNEISWMTIEALKELKTFSVKPVVKYTNKIAPDFLYACYELIMAGRALPSFAYDVNTQEALKMEPNNSYTKEDLLRASNIGCIEVAIPGRSYTDAMDCFMNLPKILRIAVDNGYVGDTLVGVKTEDPATFEEFQENFTRQLKYFINLYVEGQNKAVPFYNQYFMRPMSSTLIDDCIDKAQLLDDGGARFWSKAMNCCGIADVADSLVSVKKMVYEDEKLTFAELRDILQRDFDGYEQLRQYLVNCVPKYGNGDPDADEMAKFAVDKYCTLVSECRTFNGNVFRPGLYSFYGSVVNLGLATGALPSGRKSGAVFALNISPEHGALKSGMTAALESVTSFDHRQAVNACPVDLQLTPDTPVEILDTVTRYLDQQHALLLQVNVVNKDDLVKAQVHPERYQDLIVRVSGFSARFVMLDKAVQDEIIGRSNWA